MALAPGKPAAYGQGRHGPGSPAPGAGCFGRVSAGPTVSEPRISVVVPAYNHERWVGATLQSILEQTFTDWEVVLVDDGSKDGTRQLAEQYLPRFEGKLHVLSQANAGICRALNVGVGASRAPLIAIIASDDVMLPQRLALQVAAFEAHPNAAIIHGAALRIDESGRVTQDMRGTYVPARGACFEDFMFGRVGVCAPSVAFRRTLWEELGGFDERYRTEDVPFLLEATSRGHELQFVEEPLVCWRDTGGSLGKSTATFEADAIALRERYIPRLPPALQRPARARWYRHRFRMAALQGHWRGAGRYLTDSARGGYLWRDLPHYTVTVAAVCARQLLPMFLYRKLSALARPRVG